ncbi:MAG: efflux RND transporter periplasmic adaptor subunit [Lachnospiraceae bacterium]|nr:efflux RND transporter periplasmic adaptor subunit [Lachnospiraceae bacterium]
MKKKSLFKSGTGKGAVDAAGRKGTGGKIRGMVPAVFLMGLLGACGKKEGIPEEAVSVLEPSVFTETVTADGTVECADPHYVYSTLTLPVEQVFVKEGDRVSPGDLLCVLDTDTIEEQIALQQAAMEVTQKNASSNISAARRQYSIYEEGINNGTDANLVAAMAAADRAREACEAAQKRYADYKESLNLGMDPTLVAADQAVQQAANSIQQSQSMQYEMEDKDYVTDIQKEQAEDAVDSANLAYVQAIQRRDNLLRQSDIQLADYAKAVDDAMMNYMNAVAAYQATVRNLDNARLTSSDAVNQALRMGDVSVEELQMAQMQKKLLDAQIVSAYSGVVTAVNIEEGENSTGVLFVIEDTSDLVLTARVEEKDINHISADMKVAVTPKADGSDTYQGNVRQIADAAKKNTSGETDTSGEDAEYKVTVAIKAPDARMKIGMNAEADFIVYEQEECFAVANESIMTDDAGNHYILTLTGAGESETTERAYVTIVYEGKAFSVIEGSKVTEGVRYLPDPADYAEAAVGK